MMSIECPRPALDKLRSSGLVERIMKDKDAWFSSARSIYFNEDGFYGIFEKANEFLETVQEWETATKNRPFFRRIVELADKVEEDSFLNPRDMLMDYPEILAYMVLGDDVFNFVDYGYETQKQLEESVTSFCLSDHSSFMIDRDYYWINGDYKNNLSNSFHGDFRAFQIDISGKHYYEKTLFGEREVFDTWKDVSECRNGICASYDYWDNWLAIILKYAEILGMKDMLEIRGWKEVVDMVGFSPTNTAEAEFGSTSYDFFNLEGSLMIDGQKLDNWPLIIGGDDKKIYLPFVKDRKLSIIVDGDDGYMEFPEYSDGHFSGKKFKEVLRYEEGDLLDLLRGTYKLFARDRRKLPMIMDLFLKGELKRKIKIS